MAKKAKAKAFTVQEMMADVELLIHAVHDAPATGAPMSGSFERPFVAGDSIRSAIYSCGSAKDAPPAQQAELCEDESSDDDVDVVIAAALLARRRRRS